MLRIYQLIANDMLLTLAVVLFVAWLLGLVAFNVTTGFIHLVLVLAIVVALFHFIGGSRRSVTRV